MYSIQYVLPCASPSRFTIFPHWYQFPASHPPPCASSLQTLLPGRHPLPSRAYIYII